MADEPFKRKSTLEFGGVAAILNEAQVAIKEGMAGTKNPEGVMVGGRFRERIARMVASQLLEGVPPHVVDMLITGAALDAEHVSRPAMSDAIGQAFNFGKHAGATKEDHERPTVPATGSSKPPAP